MARSDDRHANRPSGDAATAIEGVFRQEYGVVVASMVRTLRDLDLAEDVVSEAMAAALATWPRTGVPHNPAAWLTTTARRKALDRLRRTRTQERKLAELSVLSDNEFEPELELDHDGTVDDDRLRLIFTCCHPALQVEAQVALTLRMIGGLTTREVAAAFLVSETSMYQRIVRAKRKIRDEMIPYEIPSAAELPERMTPVLAVIYLVFTEGYSAHSGSELMRVDLVAEAVRLGRILARLMPDEPEALGLLALMVLHDARRRSRVDPNGDLVLMVDQDRSSWDAAAIVEGSQLVQRALRMGRPGPYQIQAAIAAVHAESPTFEETDWQQIAALYGELSRHQPSPMVGLNQAVAVAMWRGPESGLALLDRLSTSLDGHHLYHAARADMLRRIGRIDPARESYRRALELAHNEVERRFLLLRLEETRPGAAAPGEAGRGARNG